MWKALGVLLLIAATVHSDSSLPSNDGFVIPEFIETEMRVRGENSEGGSSEADSNPIYLLPADPSYAPSGPQGYFPNNWFKGGPSAASLSPPTASEPSSPSMQGQASAEAQEPAAAADPGQSSFRSLSYDPFTPAAFNGGFGFQSAPPSIITQPQLQAQAYGSLSPPQRPSINPFTYEPYGA